VKYAVPLVGLVGAALYGVLRLAYLFFYLHLRTTPEEVGYGYSEILASQLIGAIELVLMITAILFVLGLALRYVISALRVAAKRSHKGPDPTAQDQAPELPRLAARSAIAAVILVLAGLPVLAWAEGAEAAKGFTVRNVYVLGTIRLPVLAVQAVPAEVHWVDGDAAPGLGDRPCLLYVGRAADTSVFYDVQTQESVRIPSSDIVVTLQNTTSVPVGC
jgi:hypothetical protein